MKQRIKAAAISTKNPANYLYRQQKCFVQARDFEIAAAILHDFVYGGNPARYPEANKSVSFPKDFRANIPIVVSHAFSIELYLKCLLLIEDKLPPYKHGLKTLFDLLNAKDRARIRHHFRQFNPAPMRGHGLFEILKRCDDAFEWWRYLHEKTAEEENKRCSVYDGTRVIDPIKKTIFEARPDLETKFPLP
jgi:hypothetical protein